MSKMTRPSWYFVELCPYIIPSDDNNKQPAYFQFTLAVSYPVTAYNQSVLVCVFEFRSVTKLSTNQTLILSVFIPLDFPASTLQ